jgi:serine/threonine-protein kinase
VGFYFEPEYARAKRLGEAEPAATEAGDQYQVAALIYFLLTRAHYLNFHLDRVAAYRQIEIEPPRPFLECASPAWPTVEAVLARALSKQPEARYPSMGEFERALREAVSTAGARTAAPSFAAADPADGRQFVDFIVQRYGEPGAGILDRSPSPPSCSVNYGAAGIAYLFYRLACIRGSAELLARADLWAEWALAQSGKDGAFHSCDLHLTAEMVGPVSLYHTASGIHCVRGLIAQAMGNRDGLLRDAGTFAAASSAACESLDLTLGRSSSLIGCALLYETLPPEDQMARPVLSRLGDEVLAEICSKVASTLPLDECTSVRLLGMAHGWAGILYGILRWRWASGGDVPGWVRMRIEELGALGQPVGKGIAWRLRPGGAARAPSWAGWCRGSAGYVHLWSMAHRVFQDHRFLELAERAAWHIWESSGRTGPNLCCGLTGEAYALLHLFRKTGQKEWFTRASDLGRRALEAVNRGVLIPGSLYKGDIGVALLMADLAEPMGAAMPMFETEEWASVAGV